LYPLIILPGTAAGGEDDLQQQNAADEGANNSNSNAAERSNKPSSAAGKSQGAVDANQPVEGRYLEIDYSLHH